MLVMHLRKGVIVSSQSVQTESTDEMKLYLQVRSLKLQLFKNFARFRETNRKDLVIDLVTFLKGRNTMFMLLPLQIWNYKRPWKALIIYATYSVRK